MLQKILLNRYLLDLLHNQVIGFSSRQTIIEDRSLHEYMRTAKHRLTMKLSPLRKLCKRSTYE